MRTFKRFVMLALSVVAFTGCSGPKCPICGNKPIENLGLRDGKTNVMCPEGHVWAP